MAKCFKRLQFNQQNSNRESISKSTDRGEVANNGAMARNMEKIKAKLIFDRFKVGFDIPSFSITGCTWVDNLKSISLKKKKR